MASSSDHGDPTLRQDGHPSTGRLRVHLVIETFEILLGTPFSFELDGRVEQFEPDSAASLGPLLRLHQATVASAFLSDRGELDLTFTDGGVIHIGPDPDFESFEVTGPGWHVIGVPEDGLAIFEQE